MSIGYHKTGITSRLEWTPQSTTLLEITESGDAQVVDGTFLTQSRPSGTASLPRIRPETLESFASRVQTSIPAPVRLDRLVVAAGSAAHGVEGDGPARAWEDANARCFASLSLPDTPLQLELDLGAPSLEGIDLSPLQDAANAMRRYRGVMTPPDEFRLEPVVSAALWRALATAHASSPANRLYQSTHPDFGMDGNGLPVERHFDAPWPNVYRPSYRGAPVAMPFHLDIETPTIDSAGCPAVVAVVEPLHLVRNVLLMVVLCDDGEAAFRVVVALPPDAWLLSIQGAGDRRMWFPFGAGSWGRDVRIAL